MIEITQTPILPAAVINTVRKDTHGCVVTFVGTVRNLSSGKKVISLEFDTSAQELIQKELQQVTKHIHDKWQLDDISICHRMGQLKVGEITLVIAIGAPHRQEAFEACQYVVDRLKQIAPLWKKEVTASD